VIAGYIAMGEHAGAAALGDPEGDVHDEEFVGAAIEFFLGYYRMHKLISPMCMRVCLRRWMRSARRFPAWRWRC